MFYPASPVGNGALVRLRVIRTTFLRLIGVLGVNNGADTYIQVHETSAEPAGGAVPRFAWPADAARPYMFDLPHPVDLDACTVVASSTLDTYTAVAGTPVTIQAVVAG